MPNYLISYDLSAGNSEVINAALDRGWTRLTLEGDTLRVLPESTLWGAFSTRDAGFEAFRGAVREAEKSAGPIKIKRLHIAQTGTPRVVSDKKAERDRNFTTVGDPLATCIAHQKQGVL